MTGHDEEELETSGGDAAQTTDKNRSPNIKCKLDLRLSSGFECCISSFGYFPCVSLSAADVSESSVGSIFIQPLNMERTEGSETSAALKLTPGIYPKEDIQHSKPDESLKSRINTRISKKFINKKRKWDYLKIFLRKLYCN
jgi:hypothetical protein